MFRYLVAHLPTFRLERCGWEAHQPVVLLAEEHRTLRVLATTPTAERAGVRPGMAAAEARALVPELRTELLDPEAERVDLEALAQQLLSVSPAVSTLPPDALVAEVRGADQAPGGERALLERVRIRLSHLGHQARIAIADDPATALACASWGRRDQVVPPGDSAAALAPLPLEALGLPAAELALLQSLGVRTIGAFSALPAAAVVSRLGSVGAAAHALARGRGPRAAIAPAPERSPFHAHQDLPDPVVEQEALIFVINALLREVSANLASAGKAAVRVSLRFRLDGGGDQELSVRLGEPTRDPRRMLTLIRSRLDRFALASPVIGLSLDAPDAVSFQSRQRALLDWKSVGDTLGEVMARLQDQLGEDAVRVPRLIARHRPEAEWQATPFRAASVSPPRGPAGLALAQKDDPVLAFEGHPDEEQPERPPILLPMPLAIEVIAPPDRAPRALQLDGRWVDITALEGPELRGGDWWKSSFQREYWRATLVDGRRAWIYREDGRWALHGWWDR